MRELWVLYECVLRQFSVFPRIHAPIFPHELQKDYKTFSMWLQNKDKLKHGTHYAIFQNRPPYVQIAQSYGLVHYAACVFLPIYKWLAVCVCGCGSLGCLCVLGLYGH